VLSASVAKIPQTRLEVQSERELHDSRIPGTGDPSKVARGHVCVGVSKVGSVESIKHLPAELEVDLFGERESLHQSHIQNGVTWSAQKIPGRVPKSPFSVLSESSPVEVFDDQLGPRTPGV